MNSEKLYTELVSQAAPSKKPKLFSRVVLAALFVAGLALLAFPTSHLFYPSARLLMTNGAQIEIHLYGQHSLDLCNRALNRFTDQIAVACPTCLLQQQACTKNTPKAMGPVLGDVPLPVASLRLDQGVALLQDKFVLSQSKNDQQTSNGKLLCQPSDGLTEIMTLLGGERCHEGGTPRTLNVQLKESLGVQHNLYTAVLNGIGLILAILALFLTFAHKGFSNCRVLGHRHDTVTTWASKLALASIDTIILIGIFVLFSWPKDADVYSWHNHVRTLVFSHFFVSGITVSWFWFLLEHYTRRRPFWDELQEILKVLAIMFMVNSAVSLIVDAHVNRSTHLLIWASYFFLIPSGRALTRLLLNKLGLWCRPAIFIGSGKNAREALKAISSEPSMGYKILAMVDSNNEYTKQRIIPAKPPAPPIIQVPWNELDKLLADLHKPRVIVALDSLAKTCDQELINRLALRYSNIHVIPSLRGLPLFGATLSHFFSHEVLFLTLRNNLARRSYKWIKRTFDILASSVLLIICAPLFTYVGWKIRQEDGGPVIFKQKRVGLGNKEFNFYKFRSMFKDAEDQLQTWQATQSPLWSEYVENNFKLKNDPRVLSIGKWIRSNSIDELPQLFNVLLGDMSLVGPRPLLKRELGDYGDAIQYYAEARPGITGLWQISGRSNTTFADRARLDEWYVRNWSLWYDIAILFKTVNVVFLKKGAF